MGGMENEVTHENDVGDGRGGGRRRLPANGALDIRVTYEFCKFLT